MGVDHDFVVGGFGDAAQVVVVEHLAVVVLAVGYDVAYVAALDGWVAIVDHELVGLVEVALVVDDGA